MELRKKLSITDIRRLYREHPQYEERSQKIQELTKDPWKIPAYDEVLEYINNSPSIFIRDLLPTQNDIEISLYLVQKFPDFHKYLVTMNGDQKFPDFDLPLSIFSTLTRYAGVLLQDKKNNSEVISIINYLEDLFVDQKKEVSVYISEFLELTDLYEINIKWKFYRLLTPRLKKEFDTYFSHYLH